MITVFKPNFSKLCTFFLVLGLCFSNNFCSLAQTDDISKLRIRNVQLPDTVEIGETITLTTLFINESSRVITTDFSIYYAFELDLPYYLDGEYDEAHGVQNLVIQPEDSVLVSKQILISEAKFTSNSTNVIIIWPEISGLRQAYTPRPVDYAIAEIYVIGTNNDFPIEVFEEVDNEEVQLEEEDLGDEEDDMDNTDNFDEDQNGKNTTAKLSNLSSVEDSSGFLVTKNEQYVFINKIENDIEVVEGFIFTIGGKLINQINSNSDFPLKLYNYAQPVIIQLTTQTKNDPKKTNSFIKAF